MPPAPPKPLPIFQIEGPDGAGKTTVLAAVYDLLIADGHAVMCARAPGGTPFGEAIRKLALDPNLPATPRALSLAFTAAEAQSVAWYQDELREKRVDLVLADRGFLSNFAYRHADGIPIGSSLTIALEAGVVIPRTHVLYLEVPKIERDRRLALRAGAKDRYEGRGPSYQDKVTEGYELAAAHATRIDADAPVPIVAAEIAAYIKGWL